MMQQSLIDNNTQQAEDTTTQRRELDPVFKEVITQSLEPYAPNIPTQVEVSRLPRSIDVLIILGTPQAIQRVRIETVFDYLRQRNLMEFKGKGDRLTLRDFNRIRGRSYLYMGENDILTADITVTIISARTPRNVLYSHPQDVRWQRIGSGHYQSTTDPICIHLLVCNELELEPKNYPLLLFVSSERKFRQFAQQIVAEDNDTMIHYALRSHPQIMMEVLQMAGGLTAYEKHLKEIADGLGDHLVPYLKEKILQQLTPEQRIDGLTPEQRIGGLTAEDLAHVLTPEQRIEGLTAEDLAHVLSPETKERLRQLLNGSDER